jgi:hypothetical protein
MSKKDRIAFIDTLNGNESGEDISTQPHSNNGYNVTFEVLPPMNKTHLHS